MKLFKVLSTLTFLLILAGYRNLAVAYTTNMPASIVVGQPDFTSVTQNQGQGANNPSANTVRGPFGVHFDGNKFFIADANNARVLIFNSLPTSNNASADVVVGQSSFTTNTVGTNATGLSSSVRSVWSDGQKLLINDQANSRVLIYNSIPTTNGAAADVVVGQANMNSVASNQGGSVNGNTLNGVRDIQVCNGKLIISDTNNHRILIYNSIPTSNNAFADVVVGQPNFTSSSTGLSQSRFSGPRAYCDGQRLFVVEATNHRVLIYNSIPTTNGAAADIVLGQENFTTNSAGTTANKFSTPVYAYSDTQRLYIADNGNNRLLIYNAIPTSNNVVADLVIGQSNLTTGSANQGGSPAANTLSGVLDFYIANNKLMIADSTNQRVLIYDNIVGKPGISLNAAPESRSNNLIRIIGNTSVGNPYTVANVQYAINGGSFAYAVASDGAYGGQSEGFYFDFDPTTNQPKNDQGQLIGGYTAQVKSVNNNADVTDNAFYFSPFNVMGNSNVSFSSSTTPTFSFYVNGQRTSLRDNLQKYQIQARKTDGTDGNWQTLIDNIPIDFASVKGSDDNLQKNSYAQLATNNGVYETATFLARYSNESSQVQVYSKTPITGIYEWKVVAVDKAGHGQETPVQTMYVNSSTLDSFRTSFPLTLSTLSGIGTLNLNTNNPVSNKSYTGAGLTPTFSGIAFAGSTVTANFLDQACALKTPGSAACLKTVSTTTDTNSRFKLTVPKGTLTTGKRYTTRLNVTLNQQYNQLPVFTLSP